MNGHSRAGKKFQKVVKLSENAKRCSSPDHGARFVRRLPGNRDRLHPRFTLLLIRARFYQPTTGEFTSQDPLEYVDGMSLYRGYFVFGGVDPWGLETKQEWLEIAAKNAGMAKVQRDNFHPFRGWRTPTNRAIVYDIYGHYKSIYDRNPQRLRWAGAAAIAGRAVVVPQLRKSQREYEIAFKIRTGENRIGDHIGADILMAIEAKKQEALVAGAYNIWLSTAWVHEAYLAKGIPELTTLRDSGELSEEMYQAFCKISSPLEQSIVDGNDDIVRIEQTVILQGQFESMPNIFKWAALDQMNEMAIDPFGGDSFLESGGTDITDADQRYQWMSGATGTFLRASEADRREMLDKYWNGPWEAD